MTSKMNIEDVLKKLGIKLTGKYEGHFYVIYLENSNEYAKMYSLLDEKAINTEYSNFGVNDSKNTVKITNYFEIDVDHITYNLFLIADFQEDTYYLKIGERP